MAGLVNTCGNNFLTNMTLHTNSNPPYIQAERFIPKGDFGYANYGKGRLKSMGIKFQYRLLSKKINDVIEAQPILREIALYWFPAGGTISSRVNQFVENVISKISVTEFYEETIKRGIAKQLPRHRKSLLLSKNGKWEGRMKDEFYEEEIGGAKAIMVVFYISLQNQKLQYEVSIPTLETYMALKDRKWYEQPHLLDQDFTLARKVNVEEGMVFKVLLIIKRRR